MGFETPRKNDVVIPHFLHLMDEMGILEVPGPIKLKRDEIAILGPDVDNIDLLKFMLEDRGVNFHVYKPDTYYSIEVMRMYKNVVINNPFDLISGTNFVIITQDMITINLVNMIDPQTGRYFHK